MAEAIGAGVGVLFNPSLDGFLDEATTALDYLAVIPDRGWVDHGRGSRPRFAPLPHAEALLARVAATLPLPLHGIGLSICSADFFDEEYAEQLIRSRRRLSSPWVSEHLSFSRLSTDHEVNTAVAVAVPYDRAMLDLLIPRVEFFTQRLACPFLLENSVSYLTYPDEDMSEPEFLNELCARAGCGLLLDLHNLHCNAVNHGFEPRTYLRALELDNVVEIHVAGGVPMMGFHTDSHTGPVLEAVWQLLDDVLPRAPRLRGVTFEFHESSFRLLGRDGVLAQVARARRAITLTTRAGSSA